MILEIESEIILCSGGLSGNACPGGQSHSMVELQVPCEVHLVWMFCLDEENEDQRRTMSCLRSHSYHMTEVILKAKTQICCLLVLFILDPAVFFFLKFLFIYLFIYLWLCWVFVSVRRAFSSCSKRGPLFIAGHGPLTVAASLVAEHRLQTRRLSNCGSQA